MTDLLTATTELKANAKKWQNASHATLKKLIQLRKMLQTQAKCAENIARYEERKKALKLIQAQKDLTDDFVAESIEVNV